MTSLLELVDAYAAAGPQSMSAEADEFRAEIERRLTLIQGFYGTEATRILAILETGENKPWWQQV